MIKTCRSVWFDQILLEGVVYDVHVISPPFLDTIRLINMPSMRYFGVGRHQMRHDGHSWIIHGPTVETSDEARRLYNLMIAEIKNLRCVTE